MESIYIRHKRLRIEGLQGKYTFLHVADTHALCYGEGEARARIEYAKPRIREFSKDGIPPQERLRAFVDYANREKVSGVVLTGDIIDFPSPENLAVLRDVTQELEAPYIFAPGNHDWSYFDEYHTETAIREVLPLLRPFCGGEEAFHVASVGELTFAVLDNSMDGYHPHVVERLKGVLESSKYVILVQHVPFFCDTLHEDTVKAWKRDITLGGEGIILDEHTEEVRRLLVGMPSARAVLCGHLHFFHEDTIDGALPQYVAPAGFSGGGILFEISG